MIQAKICDWGRIDYKEAWERQEEIFNGILDAKVKSRNEGKPNPGTENNHLIFCEHPHVFTLGKSGDQNNLLIGMLELNKVKATYVKTNRGGDITYHGPGQIVLYPILNIESLNLDIKTYIYKLEEVVIQTLLRYNIKADRLEGATGVWLDAEIPGKARKICAIGVKASRYVTMHGLAFNINTDLNYFNMINPCGFTDKTVTSLAKETGKQIPEEEVKELMKKEFGKVFGIELNA